MFGALFAGTTLAVSAQSATGFEGELVVAGRSYYSIQQAFNAVPEGGVIRMGPGTYTKGGTLKQSNVLMLADPDAVIEGGAVGGKAALVIQGNNTTIEGLTCRGVAVRDRNGACVRHEGSNLTLRNVTFTDSENGILAGSNPGRIIIEDSRFLRNGKAGRAHAIYVNGGELIIRRTIILGTKDQGHSIKSRADVTIIESSLVASGDGNDSRLIDLPNGGRATVQDCLLIQGPNSVNWSLFSFGVEGKLKATNTLRIEKNMIINDRQGGAEFIQANQSLAPAIIKNNVVIGNIKHDWPGRQNLYLSSREEAGLPSAPEIPEWKPPASR